MESVQSHDAGVDPMTLQEHETLKPVRTKPLHEMTPKEYADWSKATSEWLWMNDAIIAREMVEGMEEPKEHRERIMRERACLPAADYEWREIPKRKARPSRAKWGGATKEYNRIKAQERRDRVRAAVLEVRAERDARKP